MARIPKLTPNGAFEAADVLAQLDARTDTRMRDQLPVLAEELGIGGSGSGIEEVSGTVVLDSSGPAVREFWSVSATTFKANGADTLISSATGTVWRRTGSGSWGYQVVPDEWTTPVSAPDTTAPTAGTLAASDVTATGFTVTVTGASDNVGLASTPYRFSLDNGATWSAAQSSNVYTATGRTASTAYQVKAEVKDAAGNVSYATLTVTTVAAPSALAKAVMDTSPVGYWKLDDAGGAQALDSSVSGKHGTYSGATKGATGYMRGGSASIPDDDLFSPGTAQAGFTVFMLINPGSLPGRGYLVAKGTSAQYEWWLDAPSGKLRFTASTLAGNALVEYTSTDVVLTEGAWQAVAATIAQPVSGGTADLFHNGNTALSAVKTTPVTGASENGTAPVTIGRRDDTTSTWGANTGFAHLAIFRKKLTSAEIGGLMDAARTEGLIA